MRVVDLEVNSFDQITSYQKRGRYNRYSPEQRADTLGSSENGPGLLVLQLTVSRLLVSISSFIYLFISKQVSTCRKLRIEYLTRVNLETQNSDLAIEIKNLRTKPQGRPILKGKILIVQFSSGGSREVSWFQLKQITNTL